MKRILNKPISSLLAFIILLSSLGLVPTVSAVGTATEIKFGEVEGKTGDEVTVPVIISNNPGISTFFFVVEYDADALSFISADKGEVLTGGTFTPVNNSTKGELSLPWYTVNGDITEDGVLMDIKFKISESARGNYELTVRYLPQDIANASYNQIDCNVANGKISTGSMISGTVTSFGKATEPVTLRLSENGTETDKITSIDGTYCFSSVSPGTYTIEVSKLNHATRIYEITVEREDITENLKIHLIGDVTGDGKVKIGDYAKILAHVKGTSILTDYDFVCADVTGDGKIKIGDYAKVLAHVKGTSMLW